MRELLIAATVSVVIAVVTVTVINLGESDGSASQASRGPIELSAVPTASAVTGNETPEELGKALAMRVGCSACHSVDGSAGVGPSWLGLAGREETLDDGSTVLADSDYLHESIVSPNAKVVSGFAPGIMPQTFGDTLSAQEIDSLVAYIVSLGN